MYPSEEYIKLQEIINNSKTKIEKDEAERKLQILCKKEIEERKKNPPIMEF